VSPVTRCWFYFLVLRRPSFGVSHLPHLTPRLKKQCSYICILLLQNIFCGEINCTFTVRLRRNVF
jgi:hypothetical protein